MADEQTPNPKPVDKADALRGFIHKHFKAADDFNTKWNWLGAAFSLALKPGDAELPYAAQDVKAAILAAKERILFAFEAVEKDIEWVASHEQPKPAVVEEPAPEPAPEVVVEEAPAADIPAEEEA